MLVRKEAKPGLGALSEALAGQAATADGHQRLMGVPTGVEEIGLSPPNPAPECGDALLLVVLQEIEPSHRRGDDERGEKGHDRPQLELSQHHHACEDEGEHHRGAEVWLQVDIQREKAARYGLNIADVQQVIASAIGGMNVTQTIEGLERYPVNLRYPQDYRNSPEQLSLLPIVTMAGQRISLADVADIYVEDGPPAIKSENARLNGWTFIDIEGVDIGSYVVEAQRVVSENIKLPAGYSLGWSGQYEYMLRAKEKLTYVVPLTLIIIIILLYMNFRNMVEVAIIMGTLPLAMVGSIWLMYYEGYNFSVAVGVGFIALAGVAVEIGVIMLVYLNQAYNKMLSDTKNEGFPPGLEELSQAVLLGAGMRVRPVMMTAAAIIVGLLPILFGTGTGSEVMSRIAAPMVGGMVSAVLLTLLVVPAVFFLWRKRSL